MKRVILLLLVLALTPVPWAFADEIDFPNFHIRDAVCKSLGLAPDEDITRIAARNAHRLVIVSGDDWEWEEIDVSFLEHFPNLLELKLGGMAMSNLLVLKKLTKLQSLEISYCYDWLDLNVLPETQSLTTLILPGNQIGDLTILAEKYAKRKFLLLDLSSNQIQDIAPLAAFRVEVLHLNENMIDNVDTLMFLTPGLRAVFLEDNFLEGRVPVLEKLRQIASKRATGYELFIEY